MKSPKQIAKLLLEDQEKHEAVVRALHLDFNEFEKWSVKNMKLLEDSRESIHTDEDKKFNLNKDEKIGSFYALISLWRKPILAEFSSSFKYCQ